MKKQIFALVLVVAFLATVVTPISYVSANGQASDQPSTQMQTDNGNTDLMKSVINWLKDKCPIKKDEKGYYYVSDCKRYYLSDAIPPLFDFDLDTTDIFNFSEGELYGW